MLPPKPAPGQFDREGLPVEGRRTWAGARQDSFLERADGHKGRGRPGNVSYVNTGEVLKRAARKIRLRSTFTNGLGSPPGTPSPRHRLWQPGHDARGFSFRPARDRPLSQASRGP